MDKVGNADELDGELDGDDELAVAAQNAETVLISTEAAYVGEVALHVFEARPLAILDDGGPFLEGGFRLRVCTDKLLQWLFREDSHGANIKTLF